MPSQKTRRLEVLPSASTTSGPGTGWRSLAAQSSRSGSPVLTTRCLACPDQKPEPTRAYLLVQLPTDASSSNLQVILAEKKTCRGASSEQ